jgi:hypothetical protein
MFQRGRGQAFMGGELSGGSVSEGAELVVSGLTGGIESQVVVSAGGHGVAEIISAS